MKTNQDYKNAALAALKGNWPPAVVATIVYLIIYLAVSLVTNLMDVETVSMGALFAILICSLLVSFFVTLPLGVGYYNALNSLLIEDDNNLTNNMFKFAYDRTLRNVGGMLLMGLYVFLWTLLFIIPGIVKSIAYAMTPFILKDYPELSVNQAINLSMKMMKGRKFDYFWLGLSFIGWGLLCILTLGIGYLWLMPYMCTSMASFYQDVKNDYVKNCDATL